MRLTRKDALAHHSAMCRMRAFEDRLGLVYKQGQISGGVFTGKGNEALCCVASSFLSKGDILAPTHRDMGSHFSKGISLLEMARQWLARGTGGTHGRDNAAHLGDSENRVFGIISPLATMLSLAAGATLVGRIRKEQVCALTFIGDGATSLGDFHESLAFMASLKLPVVVVIENNQFAYSTPLSLQTRKEQLSDHGSIFGIPSETLDGTDMAVLHPAFAKAYAHVRSGKGPCLIEGVTWRMSGHSLADRSEYLPEGFLAEGEKNDPIRKAEAWLLKDGVEARKLEEVKQHWDREVKAAFEQALQEPAPEGSEVAKGVFAEAS
ncbi:MAG: thiamine pyrophosphate-dependent dehydrogenase E1 component subunit alpha [Planctomycetota bacterium]